MFIYFHISKRFDVIDCRCRVSVLPRVPQVARDEQVERVNELTQAIVNFFPRTEQSSPNATNGQLIIRTNRSISR